MIAVVDYGMGNLRSVSKALERLGARVVVTDDPRQVMQADKVVLPGVGSFGDAMKQLKKQRLIDPLYACFARNKPFLGICLGFQLLFEKSDESPGVSGLSVMRGVVRKLCQQGKTKLKVPQIGWNQVKKMPNSRLFRYIEDNRFFYFVHSYFADPAEKKVIAGQTQYGGRFTSAIESGNVFAVQFHPEKSQTAGLRILKTFINL